MDYPRLKRQWFNLLVVSVLLVLALPGEARAVESLDGVRFTMGFLAGGRNYRQAGFALESGGGAGAAALYEPFQRPPYTDVVAPGLTWDARVIYQYIRMTVGFDLPFPTFDGAEYVGTYLVNGADVQVSPRSISSRQLRLGLGVEPSFGRFGFFVDVYGTVDWLSTELLVGDQQTRYTATAFGFSLHGGVQWFMNKHFFAFTSVEAGVMGPVRWNARAGVGFSIH